MLELFLLIMAGIIILILAIGLVGLVFKFILHILFDAGFFLSFVAIIFITAILFCIVSYVL